MMSFNEISDTAKFLWAQRVTGLDSPDEPHFDELALPRFLAELRAAKSYLEFGSGGSTVAADRLGIPVTSVETDRFYARAVAKVLRPDTQVRLLPINVGITRVWGFPIFLRPFKWRLRRWRAYVEAPFGQMQRFPDFILVDGRFRVACALESARQARLAGAEAMLMFDDYAGRPEYHPVEEWLGAPELVGRAAFFRIGSREVPIAAVDRFARVPA